jgi:AhpD family alkylhydroperoxidase
MHAHEVQEEIAAAGRGLRGLIPDVYDGYVAMHKAAMADGVIPSKMKELIALAIAATRECDGCIAAHARNLAGAGASSQEVAEAMGVVIAMNGGPGTVWGPRAASAFEEYALQGG